MRDPITGDQTKEGMILLNPITKFIFCVFKVFGSPLILVYFALKFFKVFFEALNLLNFGKQFIFSLPFIFPFAYAYNFDNAFDHDKFIQMPDGSFTPMKEQSYPFVHLIKYYVGMIIPLDILGGPEMGETYGKGALGALILFFMIISAIFVIVGGFNILFIVVIFIVYIYKTISALKTSAMGESNNKN